MFRNDFQGVIVFFCQNGPAPGDGAQVCLQRNRLRLQLCQQVSVSTKKGAIHFLPHYRYKLEEHASQHHKKHLDTNRNNVCPICSQVKGCCKKWNTNLFLGFHTAWESEKAQGASSYFPLRFLRQELHRRGSSGETLPQWTQVRRPYSFSMDLTHLSDW